MARAFAASVARPAVARSDSSRTGPLSGTSGSPSRSIARSSSPIGSLIPPFSRRVTWAVQVTAIGPRGEGMRT